MATDAEIIERAGELGRLYWRIAADALALEQAAADAQVRELSGRIGREALDLLLPVIAGLVHATARPMPEILATLGFDPRRVVDARIARIAGLSRHAWARPEVPAIGALRRLVGEEVEDAVGMPHTVTTG